MAQLPPDGEWLMQQIGGDAVLFHRYTEAEIVRFDPADRAAIVQALKAIHGDIRLNDEQKSFACFWAGYFYAANSPADAVMDEALTLILKHADTDGAHHKQWVLARLATLLSGGAIVLEDQGVAP